MAALQKQRANAESKELELQQKEEQLQDLKNELAVERQRDFSNDSAVNHPPGWDPNVGKKVDTNVEEARMKYRLDQERKEAEAAKQDKKKPGGLQFTGSSP